MKKAVGMMLALGMLSASYGAVTIDLVGDGSGYDLLGDGAGNEAHAYRSTDVAKSFDLDGDNAYGTAGLLVFGDGGAEINNQDFTKRTQVGAIWATFAQGANFISIAQGYGQGPMDDPTVAISTNVADWGTVGSMVSTATGGAGTWGEMVTFTFNASTPQQFRIGLFSGAQGQSNGRWDPTGLRISSGGVTNSVTGLENNGNGNPNWVFFDVDLNGETSGTFTIEGQKRLATQGPSLGGITFDAPLASDASLQLSPGILSLDLVAPDASTNGTITASYIAGVSSSNNITIVSALADAGFTATVTNSIGLANPNEDITVTFTNSVGLANGETTNSTLVVTWTEVGSGVTNTSQAALDVTYINEPSSLELAPSTLSLTLSSADTSTNGTVVASFVEGTLSGDVEIVSVVATNGFSGSPTSFTLGTGNTAEDITVTYINTGDLVDHADTASSTLVVTWIAAGSGVTNTANAALEVTYFNTSGTVTNNASTTATVIDDGTPAWPGKPGVIRAGKGGGTTELIGYAAFDLSAYTSNQLQNSVFTLDYTVSVYAGAATNYPFAIEYIGTYADDSMPASGTNNIAEWQAAPTLASNTVTSIGVFSDAFDLPDTSFGGGAYALFRFKVFDVGSVPSSTQWDVAQSLTLTVAPDLTDLGTVSIGMIPGNVVLSWDLGGTYNVETNASLLFPNWGVLQSGVSSPATNAIGSEPALFYRLSN